MKVYLVVFERFDEDGKDIDIEVFDNYEKAAKRFQERIENEKANMPWVQEAFDENGDILDGYDFDECQPDTRLETYAYWSLRDAYNYLMYDYVSIVQLEVQ